MQMTEEDDGRYIFLNSWTQYGTFYHGVMFTYTRGQLPEGFRFEPGASELSVRVLADLADGEHLLHEGVHFGVRDSHLVILSAASMRTADLQVYLNWLLRERSEVLRDGAVDFQEELPPQYHQGWRNVTGVSIRLGLSREAVRDPVQGTPNSVSGKILGAARSLLSGAVGNISASRLESLDRLGIRLQLKFEGRTERIDTAVLDELATLLQHENPNSYDLEVRGIGTVRGDQIKVQKKKSLPHDGGRPHKDAVRIAMLEWIQVLLETGRVRA